MVSMSYEDSHFNRDMDVRVTGSSQGIGTMETIGECNTDIVGTVIAIHLPVRARAQKDG
jgi:hypothetical protein